MFSLEQFVNEQMNFFGDVLDKRPSQVGRGNPLVLVVDSSTPLIDRISNLLSSDIALQVCWAINNLVKLAISGKDMSELAARIPPFYCSKSSRIELTACVASTVLVKTNSSLYTPIFFEPLISRLKGIPAEEYINSLPYMLPSISEYDRKNVLIPLLYSLFSGDSAYQHAGANILIKIGPSLQLTENDFECFLSSPILTNTHYLNEAVNAFEPIFSQENPDWATVTLPAILDKLATKDKHFRVGLSDFLFNNSQRLKIPNLYTQLADEVEYAKTDPEIAIILISHIEKISVSRFVDMVTKLIGLLSYISNAPDPSIRKKLPLLLHEHPIILSRGAEEAEKCFIDIANDSDYEVRLSFVVTLPDLLLQDLPPFLKTRLLGLYIQQFSDLSEAQPSKELSENSLKMKNALRDSLVNVKLMVAAISDQKLSSHAFNSIIGLARNFSGRWRFVCKFLDAFQQIPMNLLTTQMKPILLFAESSIALNPEALFPSINSFYKFLVTLNGTNNSSTSEFMEYLVKKFAQSEKYSLRRVFIQLSTSYLGIISDSIFVDVIWPTIRDCFKNEKVHHVKAKILQFLPKFYNHFLNDKKFPYLKNECSELLQSYSLEEDPLIVQLFNSAKTIIPIQMNSPIGEASLDFSLQSFMKSRLQNSRPEFSNLPPIRLKRSNSQSLHSERFSGRSFQNKTKLAPINTRPLHYGSAHSIPSPVSPSLRSSSPKDKPFLSKRGQRLNKTSPISFKKLNPL